MNRKMTSIFLSGVLATLVASLALASAAGAAPAWKFEGKELTGTEVIVGGAENSSMALPGLITDCDNFLYRLSISNSAGTGKGEVTELPLYNCSTDSEFCAVKTITAQNLPWPSLLKTVSTKHYIVIEAVKVAIQYSGAECALGGVTAVVKGNAGGLIDNTTESATFSPESFTATGTKLMALSSQVDWKGFFPTEAFQWNREKALSVG
jgi:hypothetical protein